MLDDAEIASELSSLPGWRADAHALVREFTFADFARAMAFVTAVATRAERLDHHPEWSNVYNKVSVRLTTHSAGGVTELDVRLAHFMDEVARGLEAPSPGPAAAS